MDNKGIRRLAGAIVIRALRDYFSPARHNEAQAFLQSQGCWMLLIVLGLDPEQVDFEKIPSPGRWPGLEWLVKKGK